MISIVVCSRLDEYEALSKPLALQRVVVVQPLTQEQVTAYLNKAGGSLSAVREVIGSNPVLNESLTTPLMLNVKAV